MLDLFLTQGADLGFYCAVFALLLRGVSYWRSKKVENDATSNTELLQLTLDELKKTSNKEKKNES